jgi:hypothetical protein
MVVSGHDFKDRYMANFVVKRFGQIIFVLELAN